MPHPNSALENAFGTIGAVCWSLQLIPQIIKTWRRKDTEGLSTNMMGIWFLSGIFLGAYNVKQELSIALQVQPQCFCLFSAVAYAQGVRYDFGKSATVAWLVCIVACLVGGGVEAGFVFAARADASGRFTTACGVLSAVLIVIGLLPQLWEVYKYKAVIGISLIFLAIDLSGGVFSILSLVWSEGTFDALASASYAAVVVIETLIFLLVPILNPSYHRRQAALAAKTEGQDTEATAIGSDEESTAVKLEHAVAVAEESPREAEEDARRRRRDEEGGGL